MNVAEAMFLQALFQRTKCLCVLSPLSYQEWSDLLSDFEKGVGLDFSENASKLGRDAPVQTRSLTGDFSAPKFTSCVPADTKQCDNGRDKLNLGVPTVQ